MSKIFAVAALVGAAGFASANMVDLVQVDNTTGNADSLHPNFDNEGWFTYDLVVTVDDGDDWTSASMDALTDGVFIQHSLGGNGDPSPALIGLYPALAFDSFFDSPPTVLDGNGPGGFAEGPIWTDSTVTATWFDVDDTGGGTFTLARLTFDSPDGFLTVAGAMTYANTGGELFPYEITVPAPASAALLGLAGLVSRRRR
jgi:hypothetical protein